MKATYSPPPIHYPTNLYIDCVFAVAKCWKRSGMGELMYLDPVDIREEAKTEIPFLYLSLEDVKWALKIYERITLDNVKQNNDKTPS